MNSHACSSEDYSSRSFVMDLALCAAEGTISYLKQ
jgi:hypothetical protein